MWAKSENSDSSRPLDVEMCGGIVIVRRKFELVEATEERPEHWTYEERQMTSDQYSMYCMESVLGNILGVTDDE